jgi:hypothetical protein
MATTSNPAHDALPGGYVRVMTGPAPNTVLRRRWWGRTLLWAALVAGSIILTGIALERTFFLIVGPEPGQLRAGRLLMLAGIVTSLAAAVWSHLRRHHFWITGCVAVPAVLVGGVSLMMPDSLVPQLVGVVALPAAFAGLLGGVLARGTE